MPLDDVQRIIENLRDMIETHRDYLSTHETRTRQVLIDPLLRELGWDVSNPDAVELEYKVEPQWADYALMSNGHPLAVIEAKKLGSDIEDDKIMQVLGYANLAGIPYMIVTDGDKWGMYEVFRPGRLNDRRLMKLELSQQPAHKNALQALAMWRPNLASDDGPSEATEPVFISPEPSPDPPSSNPGEPLERQVPDNPSEDSGNWCTFESKFYPQGTKPIRLKIDTRVNQPVKHWLDVIHKVVDWLVDTERLSANECPIGTENKTFIGSQAVNRDDTPFNNPQRLSNGLFLNRGFEAAKGQWRQLRQFLDRCGVDKNTIKALY